MAAITIKKHKSSLIFTILFIISNFIPLIDSQQPSTQSYKEDEGPKITKLTRLLFYFNDTVSGRKPTAIPIISPKTKSNTYFGGLVMIDDPLTVGPNISSGIIGRAQGFYGGASLEAVELLMVMNFVFTENSEYKGSTLSVLGRNAVYTAIREMPIVGGTGVFQYARGFAQAKTYFLNTKTGDAIVEYNVTVIHSG